jgi:hypothetical protein
MREILAPMMLQSLGKITNRDKISGMQMISVKPASGPPSTVWVKCAWKPGNSGNCAVQMAFPNKENRAHSSDEVVNIVIDLAKRANDRGATHLLLLAADNDGFVPLAAYMLPIDQVGKLVKEAVSFDESLTRNGASPSIYITGKGERQAALVEIVKKYSIDLLELTKNTLFQSDAIEDLNSEPEGVSSPEKIFRSSASYLRDPKIRSYVIKRAKGCCEYCGEKGFLMADDKSHYLEAHHIIALANEGKDTVENVIALCPQHHREAHFGANRAMLETELVKLTKQKQ